MAAPTYGVNAVVTEQGRLVLIATRIGSGEPPFVIDVSSAGGAERAHVRIAGWCWLRVMAAAVQPSDAVGVC